MRNAAVIIGIDPAKPGGDDSVAYVIGGVDQSKSRFHRIVQPPRIHMIDANDLRPRGANIRDLMNNYDRNEHADHRGIDFVRAAFTAGERWGHEISMSMVITDPLRESAEFVNDWIWGPDGQFTGFARVNIFDELERQLRGYAGRREEFDWHPRDRAVEHVNFIVTVLNYDRASLYDYQLDSLRHMGLQRSMTGVAYCYIRFATYDDYVAWEMVARHDTSSRNVRIGHDD